MRCGRWKFLTDRRTALSDSFCNPRSYVISRHNLHADIFKSTVNSTRNISATPRKIWVTENRTSYFEYHSVAEHINEIMGVWSSWLDTYGGGFVSVVTSSDHETGFGVLHPAINIHTISASVLFFTLGTPFPMEPKNWLSNTKVGTIVSPCCQRPANCHATKQH